MGENKPLCCFSLGLSFVCFFFFNSAIKIKLEQNSELTRVNTSLLISSSQTSCLQFLRGMLEFLFQMFVALSTGKRQEPNTLYPSLDPRASVMLTVQGSPGSPVGRDNKEMWFWP